MEQLSLGTTIHYSGRAKSWDALTNLMNTAQVFAAERGWHFAMWDDPLGVMDDHDKDDPGYIEHDGPFRGIVIRPHRKCELVRLDFDRSYELAASTKTQFAPFGIHVQIVELLRAIEPLMANLEVTDESGLWETGEWAKARERFGAIRSLGNELCESSTEVENARISFELEPDKDDLPPEERPYG